jgi:hypothetical protein
MQGVFGVGGCAGRAAPREARRGSDAPGWWVLGHG